MGRSYAYFRQGYELSKCVNRLPGGAEQLALSIQQHTCDAMRMCECVRVGDGVESASEHSKRATANACAAQIYLAAGADRRPSGQPAAASSLETDAEGVARVPVLDLSRVLSATRWRPVVARG